jgi:hypothetical protein
MLWHVQSLNVGQRQVLRHQLLAYYVLSNKNEPMTSRTLQIDLPDDTWNRIDRLAATLPYDAQTVEKMVSVLLDMIQKGVDRPRSGEREWTIQCFGEEAIQEATRS